MMRVIKNVFLIGVLLSLFLVSCKQEKRWGEKLTDEKLELKFTDLSKEFFDLNNSFSELKAKYPFFFDPDSEDEVWERQRTDSLETAVYDSVLKTFSNSDWQKGLNGLFSRFRHYFPNEIIPEVYTYSSGLQSVYEPVLYGRREGKLFIALDGFLGKNSNFYEMQRVFPYMSKNMSPDNLLPETVRSIGREIIPFNPRQQAFVDLMVDEGKKLILADALLPDLSDNLKIGYTAEELDWAKKFEKEIWNYFVEENILFDSDKSWREGFIEPGPFSKFRNEIETESPGRIGVWTGWQICRKYMDNHPEVSLNEFLQEDTQKIFKESKYKPVK